MDILVWFQEIGLNNDLKVFSKVSALGVELVLPKRINQDEVGF